MEGIEYAYIGVISCAVGWFAYAAYTHKPTPSTPSTAILLGRPMGGTRRRARSSNRTRKN